MRSAELRAPGAFARKSRIPNSRAKHAGARSAGKLITYGAAGAGGAKRGSRERVRVDVAVRERGVVEGRSCGAREARSAG
jgi:hypothetical protein